MSAAKLLLMPIPDWAADLFPLQPLMFMHRGNYWFEHINMPLRVCCSARIECDGKRWMHVSCSRPNRLPSWEELRLVKDTFIGKERQAVQVLPPESKYVNIHPYVLHLWSCLDSDGLPDFRHERQI